jgi:hypothetical protein
VLGVKFEKSSTVLIFLEAPNINTRVLSGDDDNVSTNLNSSGLVTTLVSSYISRDIASCHDSLLTKYSFF